MTRKLMLSALLAVLMLTALIPSIFAATADELNRNDVFLTQERRGTCTLASTTMMLRRAAMLNGQENWAQITESSCRSVFWRSGRGLPYRFSYEGMTVDHDRLPGGQANRQVLIDMLAKHPEGVVLHAACVPHAVLLTDYTDGVFYCADPAPNKPEARIPITEAHGTRVENASACWYVTSPVAKPHADAAAQAPQMMPDRTESKMLSAKPTLSRLLVDRLETASAGCLIQEPLVQAQLRM